MAGGSVNVFIIQNNVQIAGRIKQLLDQIEGVAWAGSLTSAASAGEKIREVKPDVVLIERDLPDMNGLTLCSALRRDYPSTQVIFVAQNRDGETVLQAMRSGAIDFLTHSVSMDELSAAIKRAAQAAFEARQKSMQAESEPGITQPTPAFPVGRKPGAIITVYSPRGGSGVTTLATNIAVALREAAPRVALVDADLQFGDVGILLNEITNQSILDLVSRVSELDERFIASVMVSHRASGLDFLPAPQHPVFNVQINGSSFTRILEYLRYLYDFVVINTSSYITDACLAALDAAEVVVLATTQEIPTIRSVISFLDLWHDLNMSQDKLLVVLNRYQKERTINIAKINERLKQPIFLTIMEDEDSIYRSRTLGIPLMLDKKNLPVAKAMQSVANAARKKAEDTEPNRFRLFALSGFPLRS